MKNWTMKKRCKTEKEMTKKRNGRKKKKNYKDVKEMKICKNQIVKRKNTSVENFRR